MTSIPAFHVSGPSLVEGKGKVFIASRQDAASSGIFSISIGVQFNPAVNDYPTGTIKLQTDLSDGLKATFSSTSIELVNSFGKHNPTIFLTGRCKTANEKAPKGLRYWLMIADNKTDKKGTPSIAGFVIHDRNGNRVAYGTGPITGIVNVQGS